MFPKLLCHLASRWIQPMEDTGGKLEGQGQKKPGYFPPSLCADWGPISGCVSSVALTSAGLL